MLTPELNDLLQRALAEREEAELARMLAEEEQQKKDAQAAKESWRLLLDRIKAAFPALLPYAPPMPKEFTQHTPYAFVRFDFPDTLAPITMSFRRHERNECGVVLFSWEEEPMCYKTTMFSVVIYRYEEDPVLWGKEGPLKEGKAFYVITLSEALALAYESEQNRLRIVAELEASDPFAPNTEGKCPAPTT